MIKEVEHKIHKSNLKDFIKNKLLNSSTASMELNIANNAVGKNTDRYEIINEDCNILTLKLFLYYPDKK